MKTLICSLVTVCLATQALAAIEGGTCSSDSDCSGVSGLACRIQNPCKKGVCACPRGQTTYINGAYGTSCQNVPTQSTPTPKKLGATCGASAECTGYPGATCQNSQCQCISSLTAASDGIHCQPFNQGAQCSSGGVCGSTSSGSCSSGTCQCPTGYTWVSGPGDVQLPGGCVSSSSTLNLGQAQACTPAWITLAASSAKLCSSNLFCNQCPEGGNYCMSGATSLTVTLVTLLAAALCSLLFSRV